MASEQTPREQTYRDLVAANFPEAEGCPYRSGDRARHFSDCPRQTAMEVLELLDDYDWKIVRKPTGDQVEVALAAWNESIDAQLAETGMGLHVKAMAAALAAADAADGRTPDEPDEVRSSATAEDYARATARAVGLDPEKAATYLSAAPKWDKGCPDAHCALDSNHDGPHECPICHHEWNGGGGDE